MGHILRLFLSLILLTSSAWAGTSIDYNDANCQGCWVFLEGSGDTVADSSQNSYTGTFTGVGEPAWASMAGTNAPSYADYMVDFDGSDDEIDYGDVDEIESQTELSVTVWVNFDTDNTDDQVIGKYIGLQGWFVWRDNVGGDTGRSNMIKFLVRDTGNDAIALEGATNSATAGSWIHVVTTFKDNDNLRIYINGVEDANSPKSVEDVDDTGSNSLSVLAGLSDLANKQTDGKMTETSVFNRTIDSTEINDIMDNGLAPAVVAAGQVIITQCS